MRRLLSALLGLLLAPLTQADPAIGPDASATGKAVASPEDWAQWYVDAPTAATAWLSGPDAPDRTRDPAQLSAFLYDAAGHLEDRGSYQAELEVGQMALTAAQNAASPSLAAQARYAMALGHWGIGELPAAVALYTDLVDTFDRAGNWRMAGLSASNLGAVFHDADELSLAVEYTQRGLDYLRRAGDTGESLGDTLGNLALLWHQLGDAEKGDRFEQEALALRRENGDQRGVAISLNNLGDRAIRAGRNDEASHYLNASHAIIRQLDDQTMLAGSLTLQAQLDLVHGDPAAAAAKLEQSLELYAATGAEVEAAVFHVSFAEALARQTGHEEWALQLIDTHLPTLRRAGRLEKLDTLLGVRVDLLRRVGRDVEAWQTQDEREAHRIRQDAARMKERAQYLDTVFRVARQDRALREEAVARGQAETLARQARHARNSALAAAAAIALALALLVWRFVSARRTHALIARQRDELAVLNADKDAFMRIASHDLKTPLAGIRLTLGRLVHEHAAPEGSSLDHTLRQTEETAARALTLVSDFLDEQLQRSAAHLAPVALGPLLQSAAKDAQPLAQGRGLRVQVELTDAPAGWPLDQPRVERILANLLGNAIQASPPNGATPRSNASRAFAASRPPVTITTRAFLTAASASNSMPWPSGSSKSRTTRSTAVTRASHARASARVAAPPTSATPDRPPIAPHNKSRSNC